MARGIPTGPTRAAGTRAGVVEKVAEKVVRRRLSAPIVRPAVVGRSGAQPTRVLEPWPPGSGRIVTNEEVERPASITIRTVWGSQSLDWLTV